MPRAPRFRPGPARLAACCAALAAASAAPATPAADRAAVDASITAHWTELDALYRQLHQHPEIAFQETKTAALLAGRMRALGFEVTEKVGGTGLVALLRNGPGPTVLVRTELDALPMEEKTGLAYASRDRQTDANGRTSFVAQSCGHDNHMAWWVGTAQALAGMRSRWHGTLMFVAQPAEEQVSGAPAMLKDGLFTRFPKPDIGFAAHVGPGDAETVVVKDGVATSNSDAIEILFKGRGAHGSMPSASIDPIVIGAHFVSDVQSVISRQKDAGTFGVVTVGSFQAGTVSNIIPDQAVLELSLRSFTPEVRQLLLDGVTRTAQAAAAMAAAPAPDIRRQHGTAAVVNDHRLAETVYAALRDAGGPDTVRLVPASEPGWSASEDYSAFVLAGVPSVYLSVGGIDAATRAAFARRGEPVPTNHSPMFLPNHDLAIPTGIRALSLAVLSVAGKDAKR